MPDDQAFYLTRIYTFERQSLLGSHGENSIILSPIGQIVADEWVRSAFHHQNIRLDRWAVRPNSVYGLVVLTSLSEGGTQRTIRTALEPVKPRSLSSFVAGFKAAAVKRINLLHNQPGYPVWQRSYEEQLITDIDTLNHWRQQIAKDASGT